MESEELIELLAATLRRPNPPGPKYVRLFEAFARAIAGGRLAPGERLPGEIELARRLPVSLGTVQRTLRALSDHRLVVRTHGKGTFVSAERATGRDIWVYRFRDDRTGGFLPVLITLLSIDLVSEPGPWTTFFGEQTLVRVERLLRAGEEPYTYSRIYLSAASCRALVRMQPDQLESMSIHRLLEQRFGISTARFDHRICAGRLSEAACEKLEGAPGALGLCWDVWGWTEDASPTSFQRIELPHDHRPVEITGSPAPAPLLAPFEAFEIPIPAADGSLGERSRDNVETRGGPR
jgi:GntR family transcriptional regulator